MQNYAPFGSFKKGSGRPYGHYRPPCQGAPWPPEGGGHYKDIGAEG